jgi:hypothetical protein
MSDHIPGLTKMIGDTPISDSTPHNVAELGMLCRRLERELTASNAIIRQQQLLDEANLRLQDRIKRLEAVVNDPHALWANWLRGTVSLPAGIGDVRQYQDRIKRLEAAGDEAIYPFEYAARVRIWTEAKEAKP